MSEHISEDATFDSSTGFAGADADPEVIRLDSLPTDGDQEELAAARLRLLGIEIADRMPEADAEAAELLPPEVAVRLRVVPVSGTESMVRIAMLDPLDTEAVDEVATRTGRQVERIGLEPSIFAELMKSSYGTTAARMAESLAAEDGLASEQEHNLDAIEADDVHQMAEQPSLINLVNLILLEAIQSRTSDVHVEPFEEELKVKYRVDGVLREQPSPPKHLQAALVGRIKIMANMNIAERYVPQDGHITLRFEGRKVDIRVSTVPTLYGESVVMRILDKSSLPLDLKSLGMAERDRDTMDKLISKPHGLVLVTGPTGSGKTTSLYAGLSKLYDPRKKIITIEDPVEYELSGINQIPVNPKRGLTFASGLRSILRQDPDVIFVGEIRDNETVDIVIRSALTGHLVFSTLHTNDSISSVSRMIDMGAEAYLVASVIEGILAQRLGRRICESCKTVTKMDEDTRRRLAPGEVERFEGRMTVGAGCEKCGNTGFRGRLGFYELIKVGPKLRSGISEGASTIELRGMLGDDFVTMREDGILKAIEGLTTPEEVLRATQDVDDFGG
ncbi:MAG: type II/IV secretion system protein [Phycisphaera sp.]|nr:type II/IV secretion system protein [Phycisphaera sp.]